MGMSEVQICNQGLSRIGVNRISSLSDSSKAAKECNTIFDTTRDAVLADHDWGFARIFLDLALLSDTYTGWEYAYAYPTGCLSFRKILDDTGANTGTSYDIDTDTYSQSGAVAFEIISNAAGTARVIVSDKQSAEGVYTARITDPNMFSYPFIDALAYRLAADLAVPLKGKTSVQAAMFGVYRTRISMAQAQNSNESYKAPNDSSSFTQMRS